MAGNYFEQKNQNTNEKPTKKVALKVMKCPTCGANLKAANETDTITCVYCGNSIVPVKENNAPEKSEASVSFGGVLKIDGIKTASSALAYVEQLFEEYDWEVFAYAHTLSVSEVDKLVQTTKTTSADDKNTWFLCFKAVSVPFVHKISGCKQILNEVIEEYKTDIFEAYSKFDAYKRIAEMINAEKDKVISKLEKYIANAEKYGATPEEMQKLNEEVEDIKFLNNIQVFDDVENIPQITEYIEQKNVEIANKLFAKGINAQEAYFKAQEFIKEKQYRQALDILKMLEGFKDSEKLIGEVDKYFLLYPVLKMQDNLYYFDDKQTEGNTFNICPTEDDKIQPKPIAKNITWIISNYGDVLYYLNESGHLAQCDFAAKKETIISKEDFANEFYSYGNYFYLIAKKDEKRHIKRLNLATGAVSDFINDITEVICISGKNLVYRHNRKDESKKITSIANVETGEVTTLNYDEVKVEGFTDDSIVFSLPAPNDSNKNLYIKKLYSPEPEKLIEKNIYSFCGIIKGRIYYYVGNSYSQTLISVNFDAGERKGLKFHINNILFDRGKWVYFIRKAGYNSILCRFCPDDEKMNIIANDIDEFVEIKNGYLYYINDDSSLMRVRMDSTRSQLLCTNVRSVIAVRDDKIIFTSTDEAVFNFEGNLSKTIQSIYAVDLNGGGKMKLAYDVEKAAAYDDNTVYFVSKDVESNEKEKKALYLLDIDNVTVTRLIVFEVLEKDNGGFAIFLAFAVICFVFGLTLLMAGDSATFLGAMFLVVGIILMGVAFMSKASRKQ